MADSGALRVARHKAHAAGEHHLCKPENCDAAAANAQVDGTGAERARRYRKRRRLHNSGDHSMCLPGRCAALEGDDARDVTDPADVILGVTTDTSPSSRLGPRGAELWAAVCAGWTPSALHSELLLEACRIVDRLDKLDRQLRGEDWLHFRARAEDEGEVHVYIDKALAEAREQEQTLRALIVELAKVADLQPSEKKGGGVLAGLADELAAKRRNRPAG
ncbi:hypothetical protein ABZ342_44475 [Amycolatopsis sp. NPDC005961]|uniref:hypothetical protein n=1 Tax=Amycolatopsis sp. NPDC005961 TaxID=3156720 RepID=UPI003406C7D9